MILEVCVINVKFDFFQINGKKPGIALGQCGVVEEEMCE
jgi:hypothetical protein